MENTSYTGNGQDILDNPWKGLSIKDKSDIMRIAIDNGITDLHSIRQEYNEFAKGGYLAWKDKAIRYKHIDIDHDNTYDYEGWYNENPQRAWDLLKDSPDAHFDDKYKTVYHPTFSTQSKYSGVVNPKFNPQGLKGGLWRDGHSFTMSPDGYRGPVSMDERQQYLIDAEDYGVQLREADGSLPVYDNIIWGGVLPAVRVYGRNKKALGGNLYKEGGHVYEELPQLLKDAGLDIKVTSGYRKARYAGDKSWHIHHGAVDIIPQGKTTFEDIENAVYSNPGIYNYMLSNGLGILDETGRTKSSRDTMRKTRATGAHFHFGKDSVPAKAFADRMSSLWDNRMEGLKQSVETPLTGLQAVPDFIPSNPQAFFNPYSYQAPTVQKSEQPPASVEEEYSQETLDRQERAEGLKRLGMVMNMLNPSGDNSIVNTLAMLSGNQFKGGGSIHIKPENRGKFTALKKRTGHSATWFKEHGTPAQKKMAVFALNARKWKHGLGGNLFSGEEEGSQQMDNGLNLFRNTNKTGDVYYTYQNSPDGEEVRLTPLATIGNDPAYWTWTDDTGKVYTPRITRQIESTVEKDARNALSRAIGNYFGELKYQADNNIPISGKYTMPAIAMGALLPAVGEAVAGSSIAGVPVTTWADTALTSAFGAHGINHAVNEGINGLGDAAMTALEIAPLGRLVRPMYNAVKPTRNFIPTMESNMSGVRYAYNRNPELANIGTLEDYNDYLKTVFPESKVKDINYHMGPKGLQELNPSTGEVWNTNPYARGIYVTPDKSYAQMIRKFTTDRLEKPSAWTYLKRNLTPGGWDKANETFTDIYPVMVDTKKPLLTKGAWTWGIKDKKYKSLMDKYDAIVNSGPKWYQNFHSMPETIVPKTEQALILGSDADVAGFRKFMSAPQITVENAASITPAQWTAAQDAAIARGDMTEAQRLRDLHFKTNSGRNPRKYYHTVADKFNLNFNTFDTNIEGRPTAIYVTDNRPMSKSYSSYVDNFNEQNIIKREKKRLNDIKHNPLKYDEDSFIDLLMYEANPSYYMNKLLSVLKPKNIGNRTKNLYVNYYKPIKFNAENRQWNNVLKRKRTSTRDLEHKYILHGDKDAVIVNNVKDWGTKSDEIANFIENVNSSGQVIAVKNSNQLKFADAVTYDDNGIRIPLGERDNFNVNDIRYGLLPFGIGLVGYGLWNNKEQK